MRFALLCCGVALRQMEAESVEEWSRELANLRKEQREGQTRIWVGRVKVYTHLYATYLVARAQRLIDSLIVLLASLPDTRVCCAGL